MFRKTTACLMVLAVGFLSRGLLSWGWPAASKSAGHVVGAPESHTESRENGTQESGRKPTRYVQAPKAALYSSPSLSAGSPVAELRLGSAVGLAEERSGWSRVVVWGWVPSEALSETRPGESSGLPNAQGNPGEIGPRGPTKQTGLPETTLEPDIDDFGRPITDANKASRLTITTVFDDADQGKPRIGISVTLADPRGRLVGYDLVDSDRAKIRFDFTLYEKRRVAGGHTRGQKLHSGSVELQDWKDGIYSVGRKCFIPLSEIATNEGDTAGILVVRAQMPNGRVIYGRDYDAPLKAEPSEKSSEKKE